MADHDEYLAARQRFTEWDYTSADVRSRQVYHDVHFPEPDGGRDPLDVADALQRALDQRRKGGSGEVVSG